MAGAPYRVQFTDGSVREGTLDAEGKARLDGLSPALAGTPVEVTFGEAAGAYEALPGRAEPNPAYRGSEAAFDESLLQARPMLASAGGVESLAALGRSARSFLPDIPDAIGDVVDWIWGVIQGDFAENPSNSQIIAGAAITMIPGVDQVADVRDVIANLARLRDPAERNHPGSQTYLMLATTAVGVVPVVGSPVKGALRLAVRNADAGRDALFAVLRRLGRRDPAAFINQHLSAAAIRGYVQQGLGLVRTKVEAVISGMIRFGRRWRIGRLVTAATDFWRQFTELIAGVERGVRQAADTLGAQIMTMSRRGDSRTRARGSTGGTVRAQPAANDPPGGGGGGGGGGRGPRRSFTPAQREMIEEMRRNGVKFDEAKLLDVRRTPEGKVVFLERGGPDAGFQHIIDDHGADFARRGIPPDRLQDVIMDTLERGRVVGYQGKGTGRPIYEAVVDGRPQRIAITTGSNGYIVGANPN